ncbi:Uncharacterised protein [Serratia quinivorans]|nr:Uncharacterised protein [Serratia quinivorans]
MSENVRISIFGLLQHYVLFPPRIEVFTSHFSDLCPSNFCANSFPFSFSYTGTGSQADPLRSIAEAARRVRPDQSNTLHLKAGQTFTLTENITVSSGAVRTLTVYDDPWIDGDKVPDKSPQYPNYMGWSVAQVNRPVIKPVVTYDEVGEFYSIFFFNAIGGGSVGCYAIAFDLKPDNDIDSTGRQSWLRYNEAIFYGSSGGTAMFYGCTFTLPDIPAGAQGTPSGWWKLSSTSSSGAVINTQFSSCHWNEGGGEFLVQCGGAGVSVYATTWPTDADNPIPSPGTKLVENILTRLPAGGVSGIVRGASNMPRNVSANMVL